MDGPGNDGSQPDDHTLIARLLDGDQDAMRLLIDRYDRLIRFTIYKAAARHCQRDPGWLDARANEAWTGIVVSLRREVRRGPPANVSAYFIQIARNKCLDAVRKAQSRQMIPIDEALWSGQVAAEAITDPAENPAALLADLEQAEAVRGCIAQLNEDDRLICCEIDLIADARWKEAAGRLQMPESTLRSRWRVVVQRLQTCLEKKNREKFAPPDASNDS